MRRGFTLIELLVAVSIFSMVMLIVVSSLLTMVDANRKGQAIAAVMNNLNFALESMSRSARTGTDYRCGNGYPLATTGENCAISPFGTYFRFTASDGKIVYYRFANNSLERCIDTSPGTTCDPINNNWLPMVGTEVVLPSSGEPSKFIVVGAGAFGVDNIQPRAVFVVRGNATVSGENTKFDIQTTVVQRTPDR